MSVVESQKTKPRAVSLQHYPFKFSFPLHFSSLFKASAERVSSISRSICRALRVSDLLIHVETFMQRDRKNGSNEIQSHHRVYFPDHSMYTHRWVRAKIKSERESHEVHMLGTWFSLVSHFMPLSRVTNWWRQARCVDTLSHEFGLMLALRRYAMFSHEHRRWWCMCTR